MLLTLCCVFRATEIDANGKKQKKRKHNQLQTSHGDILADVTAQHDEGHVSDDVAIDVIGIADDAEGDYVLCNQGNEKGKVQIGKETKNIPELIFAMEQSEKCIFHLCKVKIFLFSSLQTVYCTTPI